MDAVKASTTADGNSPGAGLTPSTVPINDLPKDEFRALYGPWHGLAPAEVATLLAGCPFRWWIAGGWAIEAGGGRARRHEDTDLAVLRHDLASVRAWLSRFHLWEAHDGTLRPLRPGDDITPEREQLWMRRDAYGPWLLDIVLSPSVDDEWIYKRDERIRLPLDDVGFVDAEQISYMRPEIVLLFKAKHVRKKDEADFATALDGLEDAGREFLIRALRLTLPAHPWLATLESRRSRC
jgi:hypothetical protein